MYQSASPDEITLVNLAKSLGYEFRQSTDHYAKIKIPIKRNRHDKSLTLEEHNNSGTTFLGQSTNHLQSIQSEASLDLSAMDFDRTL